MAKTAQQLGDWALWVFNSKWLYGMGCYGQRLQTHYPILAKSWYYTSKNPSGFTKLTAVYNTGANPRLYDCHGIVDGFRMNDDRTAEIDFDPSIDISANMEMNRVKAAGDVGVDYFPINVQFKDNAGYGYWKDGHFGVGVGNGEVVDIWSTGYPARKRDQGLGNWTYCLKCYGIDYTNATGGEEEVLQRGDKGDQVKYWQRALLKAGYKLPLYGADSDFGSETDAATKAFQAKMLIPVTGYVNTLTFAVMCNVLQSITTIDPLLKAELEQTKLTLSKAITDLGTANTFNTLLSTKIERARTELA